MPIGLKQQDQIKLYNVHNSHFRMVGLVQSSFIWWYLNMKYKNAAASPVCPYKVLFVPFSSG